MNQDNRLEPLEDLVGGLFVDRHYELDPFWEWATSSLSERPSWKLWAIQLEQKFA